MEFSPAPGLSLSDDETSSLGVYRPGDMAGLRLAGEYIVHCTNESCTIADINNTPQPQIPITSPSLVATNKQINNRTIFLSREIDSLTL